MTDVVNPKSASPDQLLPYHKKISAEGKALMKCFISYTYMVLKSGVPVLPVMGSGNAAAWITHYSFSSAIISCMASPKSAVKEKMKYSKTAGSASIGSASSEKGKPISPYSIFMILNSFPRSAGAYKKIFIKINKKCNAVS